MRAPSECGRRRRRKTGRGGVLAWAALLCWLAGGRAAAQTVRFGPYREVAVPEYATVRIGPFYSDWLFTQTAGFRYTDSRGAGTDFLDFNRRGVIREDGAEYPLRSTFSMRNYLIVTRQIDVEFAARATYAHYPNQTQEDELDIDLGEEGILGTFSMGFQLTPFVQGTLSDQMLYRTDYIDTRGISDRYGGERYVYFYNTARADLNWLLARKQEVSVAVSRSDMIPRDDAFAEQERYWYEESVSLRHTLSEGVSVGARAGFVQTRYASSERSNTDRESYGLFSRVERGGIPLTASSTLALGVGYTRGESSTRLTEDGRQTEGDEEQTITGNASLATQLRRNLAHSVSYDRGMRSGFDSDFEIFDSLEYRIRWTGAAAAVTLYTRWLEVRPSAEGGNGYTDRVTGAEAAFPVTSFMTLDASSSYAQRENRFTLAEGALESTNDYNTWVSRIGTSFAITRSIDFIAYYMHIERESDNDNLSYQRNIYEAMLRYTHRF